MEMDRYSYWREYIVARHSTLLVLGAAFIAMTLISMLTGKTLVKYRGIVSRAEDPKTFRDSIVADFVIGLVCFGLYLYAAMAGNW